MSWLFACHKFKIIVVTSLQQFSGESGLAAEVRGGGGREAQNGAGAVLSPGEAGEDQTG